MEWERIRKHPEDCVGANLLHYDGYARTFIIKLRNCKNLGNAHDRHRAAGRKTPSVGSRFVPNQFIGNDRTPLARMLPSIIGRPAWGS